MSKRPQRFGITLQLSVKAALFLAVLWMAPLAVPAAAPETDLSGWRSYRDIRIPENQPDGLVGVALESALLENCRPDLQDLRVASRDGSLVPFAITDASVGAENNPFPVRVTNISGNAGKWTDIWIDKTAKVLSHRTLIQTTSKGFVRKVEIRGSDTGREWYVIRMDGLIADAASPLPVSSLAVTYPVNNFQYLHIRILDDDQPPLKIGGMMCYPPADDSAYAKPLDVRILENRSDRAGNSTIVVADLGEKRFPLVSVAITTPAVEFVKKVRLRGGSSPSPESWKTILEGTFFRLRKEAALAEDLTAIAKPQTCRYVMMELYGGTAGTVPVESLIATGGIPLLVFQHSRGSEYRLYYDNPAAGPTSRASMPSGADLVRTETLFRETSLGPPQKNTVRAALRPTVRPETRGGFGFRQIIGIVLLVTGLLVLFTIMLRRRTSNRAERERNSRIFGTRM